MQKLRVFLLFFLFSSVNMAADKYIHITTPVDGAVVDPNRPLQVSGTGKGLFEGNVVVQIDGPAGDQLVLVPTTMRSGNIAAEGVWKISITLPAKVPDTLSLVAFSPSPKEGDRVITSQTILLTAQKQSGLEDTDWQLSRYRDVTGSMRGVLPDAKVTANFGDSKASGGAGCNRFNAAYEVSGDQITIGPAMTTRMHCAEPEGIMEQEQEYLQALSRARVYELNDSGLKLRDEKGSLQAGFVVGDKVQE